MTQLFVRTDLNSSFTSVGWEYNPRMFYKTLVLVRSFAVRSISAICRMYEHRGCLPACLPACLPLPRIKSRKNYSEQKVSFCCFRKIIISSRALRMFMLQYTVARRTQLTRLVVYVTALFARISFFNPWPLLVERASQSALKKATISSHRNCNAI